MPNVRIEEATREHIPVFADRLRPADVEECERAGSGPLATLIDGFDKSDKVWVGFIDDEPAAIFGEIVTSVTSNTAFLWCLTTDVVEKHRKLYARKSVRILNWLLSRYSVVYCAVDSQYIDAMFWLEWLGFGIVKEHGHFYIMAVRR